MIRTGLIALFAISGSVAFSHETATPQTQVITSDFGPRFLNAARTLPDWHRGVDYGLAQSVEVRAIEDATIRGMTWNAQTGLTTVRTHGNHIFRYLHMFPDSQSLPINEVQFWLRRTDQGNLAIVRWTPGFEGERADYILVEEANLNDTVSDFLGEPISDPTGNAPAVRTATLFANDGVGPVGNAGTQAVHLHIDLSNVANEQLSQNPLEHIVHPATAFNVTLLDQNGNVRPNGFIPNPNDPASTFLKVRVNSAQGLDLESVELFVDNTTFGGLVRSFSYGGFTVAHDPLHTDIENNGAADLDGPVFFDGVRNGVRPDGAGLDDFVYTDWQAANSAVSPSNLAEGERRLIVCWTNIRNVTNCDTSVSFAIPSPDSSTRTA